MALQDWLELHRPDIDEDEFGARCCGQCPGKDL